ncbi:MAG: 3-methyl-2-oxobutanoate hydroxymethyltransferase, partial [Sphingomonas sp.]
KRYEDMAGRISAAAETYAAEVRARSFPGPDQIYPPKA